MKVFLVNPPSLSLPTALRISPPLGLAYVASYLEAHGHEVVVLDATLSARRGKREEGGLVRVGMTPGEIRRKVEAWGAEVVGVSCVSSTLRGEVATLVREVRKTGAKVVVGGVHASLRPEEVVTDGADFAVVGEGEETMLELVETLEREGSPHRVKGVVWKKGGKVVRNPPRPPLRELDSLPFPAWHLFPMEEYFRVKGHAAAVRGRVAPVLTSRGCVNHCIFCSVPLVWGCWRARSPANVVEEIEWLVERWGVEEVHFEDDNLSLDQERMRGICREMVRRKVEVDWATPNGIDVRTLTTDLLEEMRRSGCYCLSFGLEHGDPLFRERMGKLLQPSHVRRIVKKAKELGIWTHAFFMVGWPWETKESLERTLRFAEEVGVDFATFFAVVPFPGTPLERVWEKRGLDKPDLSFHPQFQPQVDLETLRAEELGRWLEKASLRFQTRVFFRWLRSPSELLARLRSAEDVQFFFRLVRHFAGEVVRRYG
ncbi:MAG: radical SAM protein [Candidatus Hadarchaeales archaeon]